MSEQSAPTWPVVCANASESKFADMAGVVHGAINFVASRVAQAIRVDTSVGAVHCTMVPPVSDHRRSLFHTFVS